MNETRDEHLTAEEIAHGQRLAPIWEAFERINARYSPGLNWLSFLEGHEVGQQAERARILAALATHGYHRLEPVAKTRADPTGLFGYQKTVYIGCARCQLPKMDHQADWLFDLLEEEE